MDENKIDHRKIYAKGWYDGVAAAKAGNVVSLHKGDNMRQNVLEAKLRNASSTEKKIFEAIPISEAWTLKQICTEIHRLKLTALNMRSVEWCVRTLKDQGLVVESSPGCFQRVQFRDKPLKAEEPMPESETVAEKPSKSNIQKKFIEVAERMRKFAEEVEMLSLELDEIFEQKDQEFKKLHELKQLIKSLGS